MSIDIVVLAAGKGSRMKSKLPKVLQPLANKPLLQHVIDTSKAIDDSRLHIVIGHGAELVQKVITEPVNWCFQLEQLGTGHAVQQALPTLADEGKTLILYGDVPLVKSETLLALLKLCDNDNLALLTVSLENPTGYGRIVREAGIVKAIVEQKDANEEQLAICEVNTGILAVENTWLKTVLAQINNENAQGEYYLTDIISLSESQGKIISALCIKDDVEVQGVNDKRQLATLERQFQLRIANKLLDKGVTLLDPARIDVRGDLSVETDVSIDVNCVFEGSVHLAQGVQIDANCIIGSKGATVTIAANTQIKANTIIEAGIIGENSIIGPFARIRPGTELGSNTKVGNFVETKKTIVGDGSKINHLSYIGDATLGKNVNVGAGTITCNYDGANKFQTEIADEAFIGSNTSLVAPVKVGFKATVAAGSTITKTIENEELALARAKQKNLSGWVRPKKKK